MKKVDIYLESMFDERNVVEEKRVSGGVIVKRNEDMDLVVLLIQRSKDDHWPLHWEFPRGGCDGGEGKNDLGESLHQCLVREVKEESGLDVEIINIIDNFQYIAKKGTVKTTQYNYLCRMKDSNQKVKLSKEHDDFKWVYTLGEIQTLVNATEMRNTIIKAFQMFKETDNIISIPEEGTVQKIQESYNTHETQDPIPCVKECDKLIPLENKGPLSYLCKNLCRLQHFKITQAPENVIEEQILKIERATSTTESYIAKLIAEGKIMRAKFIKATMDRLLQHEFKPFNTST